MSNNGNMQNRWLSGSVICLLLGLGIYLASTPRGMMFAQSVAGIGHSFSVGRATLTRNENWLLLVSRETGESPTLKLGLIPAGSDQDVPPGRFYTFEDVVHSGMITFADIDAQTATRLRTNTLEGVGCITRQDIVGRRLVQCKAGGDKVLIYDIDRLFFVAISSDELSLIAQVLNVIGK